MKKIKLPLEMANGVLVRTLDELKENWDLEKVLNYYLNGKLQTWLTDRYYTELAEEVSALNGINDNTELQKKLCNIFGIEAEDDLVDMEAVAERSRRLEILRQYTADDAVLKNVDTVAFNQEELADLLDEDEPVIYLCDNKFSVPLSVTGKKYIGLGDVEIQVNSKDFVDFTKLGIELVNVHFNKEYEELVNSNVVLYKKGEELEAAEKYAEALEIYKKAGAMGNSDGLFRAGKFYHEGRVGVAVNYELARKYYDEAAKRGNNAAFNNIGCMYVEGKGVNKDYKEAIDWFMKAANLGNYYAMRNIGNLYKNGNGVEQSFDKAIEWYKKAIEFGYKIAGADIGDMYYYGRGVNRDYISAMNWYKKATDSAYANYMIGFMYQFGEGVPVNLDTALEYYKQAMVGGYYNENYLDDPTYRYAYNLFHKYKKYDEAVNAMKKYYTNEQLRHFVNAIYKNANEFDFPYNSLGISSYYLAPQVEVMVGSSDREAFNELENRIYERRNEGYSKYQQSISSAINEYFENINIMIRKVTFVKYLVEKEEFKNELDSSNVSSSISYALTNVQIPMVYTSNYYISYKSENNGSFFSPCYTYNLSYNGDISQLEKEFIKNVSDNIASIHNQIKNLFISEIKNLLSKI